MSVPNIQQSVSGGGTTSFATVSFPNPNGAGNGLLIGLLAQPTSGSTTGLSLSDNNGNVYLPVFSPQTSKAGGWNVFKCANPILTPNAIITITPSATFSGGPGTLRSWNLIGVEFNNVSITDIVGASSQTHSTNTSLSSQPGGTSAVAFSFDTSTTQGNFGSRISGPPPWAFINLVTTGGSIILAAESENFPPGTVNFTDTGISLAGVMLIVLASTPALNQLRTHFLDSDIQADESDFHFLDSDVQVDLFGIHSLDAYLLFPFPGNFHSIDAFVDTGPKPRMIIRSEKFLPNIIRNVGG